MPKPDPTEASRYLDGRLVVKIKETERAAWQAAADKVELELSTWIRRALKNAPDQVVKTMRDDELSSVNLQVRVNTAAKAEWEVLAENAGLSLTQWVRAVLNAACRRRAKT